MKFPNSGFTWAWSVLQHDPSVFSSHVNDCPACSDTVMLSDRLIYPHVSLRQIQPASLLLSLHQGFQVVSDFFFFNLNLNSPSDSAVRQNKLFKLFNEEVQSTAAGVQTHLEWRWLTSYRCAGRCTCLCVFLAVGRCVTGLICIDAASGFLKTYTDTNTLGEKLLNIYFLFWIILAYSLPLLVPLKGLENLFSHLDAYWDWWGST